MKKFTTRFLAAFLSVLMLISAIPMGIVAQGGSTEVSGSVIWPNCDEIRYYNDTPFLFCNYQPVGEVTMNEAGGGAIFWGWVVAYKEIKGYSYSVNGGEKIFDNSFEVEDPEVTKYVETYYPYASDVSRFKVSVPMTEGIYNVRVFVEYEDDTYELFWSCNVTLKKYEKNMLKSEWVDLSHVSYDEIIDNNDNQIIAISGMIENTIRVTVDMDQTAVFWGWVAAAKKIKGFAYSVDGGDLIYDESFKRETEQAVIEAAENYVTNDGRHCTDASRFKVPVPTKSGECISRIYILYEDSTAELFWTCAINKTLEDGDGRTYAEFNGHYYKLFDTSCTWEYAKAYCENLGGYLATITSAEENNFVYNLIHNGGKRDYFLGGLNPSGDEIKWITGEISEYRNWDNKEPNDGMGKYEPYLEIYKSSGKWNDTNDTEAKYNGFICEWDEDEDKGEESAQDKYLRQHLDFVNSQTYYTAINDYRYAEILWENNHAGASKTVAEFVYDVQEGFFETISFQEMSSLENPYDVIILDLLSSDNTSASLSGAVNSSILNTMNTVIGDLIKTFQADKEWAIDSKIAVDLSGFLNLEQKDYSSNELYKSLDKLFDGKSTEQINSLFSKYNCFSTVLSEIKDGAKGVDYFLNILKYIASIEAYYSASVEFKAILKEVADTMPNVNETYGVEFKETYDNYSSCTDYDSIVQNILDYSSEEGFWLVTGYMSDFLQNSALKFCKTALKMSETAASTLVASLWAAKTGFELGNMITNNDTSINCRRMLRALYMLDEAIYQVMNDHAYALNVNPSYKEALYFDAAFGMYKSVQLNSLSYHKKFMSAYGTSFITFLWGKRKIEAFKREAEAQAVIIDTWKNINCHDENSSDGFKYAKSNTVVVACPTDVYVFRKSDGELVAYVENNIVYCTDDNLTVVVDSNEKAICVPNLNDYDIAIFATDSGSMTVEYIVSTPERTHNEREVQFNNVSLASGSSFDMKINSDSSLYLVNQNSQVILPDLDTANLAFKSASLTLYDNLAVNYKVDATLFESGEYTDPYVVFELNGVETKVTDYNISGSRYVFTFRNLGPNKMNDTIYATLYANHEGREYGSETKKYSVAEYCYSMLELYPDDEYSKLRTLIVDLLNYGADSQIYTDYNTDDLVNSTLSTEQKSWGTITDPVMESILDTHYETVEAPTATWKGAGLMLTDSIVMKFKFKTDCPDDLTVKIRTESDEWNIQADQFIKDGDIYYVKFNELNAGQMSETIYITVYDGDMPVSNTARYSIESYVYEAQNSTDEKLAALVISMIKYGNSAYAYVN